MDLLILTVFFLRILTHSLMNAFYPLQAISYSSFAPPPTPTPTLPCLLFSVFGVLFVVLVLAYMVP